MSDTKYTSISRIFAKLYRDLPLDNIDEDDVIEWAGEALEAINSVSVDEEAIYFAEVKDHQCKLPSGLQTIIQVALNHCDNVGNDAFCPKAVAEEIAVEPLGPALPVILDCKGQPAQDYEVAYYRPFFDLQHEYLGWINSAHYQKYTPIRLATGTGLDGLICSKDEKDIPYGTQEYRVIQGQYLRFTFREGIVAIAYTRNVTDPETGYPMIPDDYSTTTAITKYITMKLMEREFYANREGSTGKLQKAEQDWQWYCKQAGNKYFIPNGIDEHQNLLDQRGYMLPNNRKYYNFFGNLGKAENRSFNDPDGRNRSHRFFLRR